MENEGATAVAQPDAADRDPMSYETPIDSGNTAGGNASDDGSTQDPNTSSGTTPATATDANAGSALPPALIQQAVAAGLPLAEAQALTPAQYQFAMQQRFGPQGQQQQQTEPGQAPTQGQQQQQQQQQQPEPFGKLDLAEVLGEDIDPEFREMADKLSNAYATKFDQLHQELAQVTGYIQQQQAQAFVTEIDAYFKDAKSDLFGTEAYGELRQNPAAQQLLANRETLIAAIDQVQAFQAQAGLPEMPLAQAAEAAMAMAFPSQHLKSARTNARQNVTNQLRNAAGEFASPTTVDSTDPNAGKSPEDRAVDAVQEKLRKFGFS